MGETSEGDRVPVVSEGIQTDMDERRLIKPDELEQIVAALESVNQQLLSVALKVEEIAKAATRPALPLQSGGPSLEFPGMDERGARRETHFEYLRRNLDEIKTDQKTIISCLSALPTRRYLESRRWQWAAMAIAIIALTVGGITGGLAFIARFAG